MNTVSLSPSGRKIISTASASTRRHRPLATCEHTPHGKTARTTWAIIVVSLMLAGSFFLRASSIPTGLSQSQSYLACYISLITAFCYLLLNWKLQANHVAATFAALTLLSLLSADDLFGSASRWAGWFLIFATVGPLFVNELQLKLSVLHWTRKLILGLAVGSMLLNLLGIRLSGRGMFFGLMNHTMLLAPIAALAALDIFCTLRKERSRLNMFLLVTCCVTCIGAGSRGAVLGLSAGILTHVAHRRQGILVLLLTGLTLAGVTYFRPTEERRAGAVGTDLSSGVYAELIKKGTNNTRGFLWTARITEFRSSPVLGIGFQQQDIYRESSKRITALEPGSCYLAVLSMTGIAGTMGFVVLLTVTTLAIWGRNSGIPSEYRDLFRGWTAFFAVHMVIEGYIFACGSILCFLLWLTCGCILSLHHMGRQKQVRMRAQLKMKQLQRKAARADSRPQEAAAA